MNTQQLQCFLCVADKLNFTKAAEELYLSTPTVTHHIKNLEEELNTLLFIRTSRMVKLTEAGTMFYNDAKEIMSKIDIAEKRVQKITSKNISSIRLGCSSNAELAYIENILHDMQTKFPQVYPQIIVSDYFSLKNLFNNKQLDVVLATKEMTKDMQECTFKKIKEVINYALMSEKSVLKNKNNILFEDLKKECLITLHPKFIPFQYGNKLQEKITLHSQSHFNITCENDQAGILLAKSGYGIAILPEFCIPANLNHLITLPIANEDYKIDYGIAFHKNIKTDYIKYFINNFHFESHNRDFL